MSLLLRVLGLMCFAAPCFCQWSAKQSEVLGCTKRSLYCRGQPFDDFNTGFNGAVAAICVGKSREEDTGARGLPFIEVSYAGQYVGHGGLESPQRHGKTCYNLGMGEVITKVEVELAESEDNRVQSLRFTSNRGRSSDWFGRAHDNGPQDVVRLLTPQSNNTHLVAVHGFGQNIDVDDRMIEGFGVYWGSGGGSGYWKPSLSCIGCRSWSFEYDYGTDHREMEDPEAWAASVTQEMGFSFAGFSSQTKIEQDHAKIMMLNTKESFLTEVTKKSFTCNKTYLYQWVWESRFDTPSSPTTTYTSFMVCTDVAPCCLPFTFSKDPTKCDLQPDAPNTCHYTPPNPKPHQCEGPFKYKKHLRVYHIIPNGASGGLKNKNAGDALGDMGFIFGTRAAPNARGVERYYKDGYIELVHVSVDEWGQYQRCDHRKGSNHSSCQHQQKFVRAGREKDAHTGGWWYSFPAAGENSHWEQLNSGSCKRVRVQAKCVIDELAKKAGCKCSQEAFTSCAKCINNNLSDKLKERYWDEAILGGACPSLPDQEPPHSPQGSHSTAHVEHVHVDGILV